MKPAKGASRATVMMPAAILVALAIAACGSSSSGGSKNGSTGANNKSTTKQKGQAAFTACLDQHGVTLPKGAAGSVGSGGIPRGAQPGGGPDGLPPGGTTPSGAPPAGGSGRGFPGGGLGGGNSKFAKAIQACRSKLPAGSRFGQGPAGGGANGAGAPAFTATTLKSFVACVRKNGYPQMPEASSTSKGSLFPKSVQSNAKFEAASKKCASVLTRSPSGQAAAPNA